MKKTVVRSFLLLILCSAFFLLAAGTAGAETRTVPEGKTEGSCSPDAAYFSGVYVCNINVAPIQTYSKDGSYILRLSGGNYSDEPVIAGQVTQISGDEGMAGAFSIADDGYGMALQFNMYKNIKNPGEASFRMELESEHCWYSGEFSVKLVPLRDITVSGLTESLTVYCGDPVKQGSGITCRIEPEDVPVRFRIGTPDQLYEGETDDCKYNYESFTAKRTGEFKTLLITMLGDNHVELHSSLTIVSEEFELGKGREEADTVADEEKLSGPFFINGDVSGQTALPLALTRGDTTENVVGCTVTFLNGDEALKDKVTFREDESEGNIGLVYDLRDITAPAGAAFRLEMFSEHYYAIRTIQPVVKDASEVSVTLSRNSIDLYTEEGFYPDDAAALVTVSPDYPFDCRFFSDGMEDYFDNGDYSVSPHSFLAETAGDYSILLRVSAGSNTLTCDFPLTLHVQDRQAAKTATETAAEATADKASASAGEPINRYNVTSYGTFTGDETVNATCYDFDNQLSHVWLYVPSTMPADSEVIRPTSLSIYPHLYPLKGSGDSEIPDCYSVEFISGDEHLKNALKFYEYTQNYGDNERMLNFYTDQDQLTAPGEATFRVRLKSRKLYYETEVSILVLSWEEEPLFDLVNSSASAAVDLGEGNKNIYSQYDLAGMFIADHYSQVAAAHPKYSDKGYYNWRLSAYPSETYSEEQIAQGYDYDGNTYQFLQHGVYQFHIYYGFGNVYYYQDVTLTALSYGIRKDGVPAPGGSVRFSIRDSEPEAGRTFTWSLEGEGMTLDPETGVLTIPDSAAEGTAFTVTATPSDGGAPVSCSSSVWSGALPMDTFSQEDSTNGFTVPVINSSDMTTGYSGNALVNYTADEDAGFLLTLMYQTIYLDRFAKDDETAEQIYDFLMEDSTLKTTEQKTIRIDGYPARLMVADPQSFSGDAAGYAGILLYARNNVCMYTILSTEAKDGTAPEDVPPVTAADLEKLAAHMAYNPAKAYITLEDGLLTLDTKDGSHALTAGKKVQILASFANPDLVNNRSKNDGVEWSVTAAETGEPADGVSIDGKGSLSAGKDLAEPVTVRVHAVSTYFGTEADLEITVIPPVKAISVEPAEITFYTGTEQTETVRAVLDPDTVPTIGITWTPAKKDIVEITAAEDGTAQIRPLAAGKTTIAVKEPGGKNATLKVSVVDPVTGVELATSGKQKPGGTVTVKATLEPKTAGNKTLEWSLDVDESIASINGKGQIKISKDAASGTVITVTCRALGAPEPVEQIIQFTVE